MNRKEIISDEEALDLAKASDEEAVRSIESLRWLVFMVILAGCLGLVIFI